MEFIWNLTAFIITIGVLITAHEFGHYFIARQCGVHIERFSIGFGKILWRKFNKHNTEFIIAMIPLGGYVKMMDEHTSIIPPEFRNMAFNNKKIWQRTAIIIAGPIANFLLAVIVYCLVYMIGTQSTKPIIEDIKPGSIAEFAKLTPKMEIISIDDIDTPNWNTVRLALIAKIGNSKIKTKILVEGSKKPLTKIINLKHWNFDPEKQDPIISIGIMPISSKTNNIIKKIKIGTAGDRSGLIPNDKIINVNGKNLNNWNTINNIIYNNPNIPLLLKIERNKKIIFLTLTPDIKKEQNNKQVGFAGIEFLVKPLENKYKIIEQYEPFLAFYKSIKKTWQLIKITVNMISKLCIGDIKLNNLNGPISIAKGAGVSAELGLVYYLMFIALISINLGVVNLFPLSVLDGGQLFFLLIEKIKGKPVSAKIQNISFKISILILIILMTLALFNDLSRF
ncbi:sigma E protease regulator RseP [Candidatus Providencia siddallii]|uniref:Zinc metalloprotease n=1 Tax=Candidatus Providencia siddallii TaxID=1715285 RepID=A0ABP1CDN7_9GAMM